MHSQPQSTRGRRQSGEIAWPDRSGVGKANVVGRSRNSASRSCSTGQFKGKGGRMQWWPGNVEAAIPYISPTIPTPPTHHIPSTPHRSRFYVATFLAQCVRVPLAGKRSNKELQAKKRNIEAEKSRITGPLFFAIEGIHVLRSYLIKITS